MFLSKLGYSELVQSLFEKMTFSLVAPHHRFFRCCFELIVVCTHPFAVAATTIVVVVATATATVAVVIAATVTVAVNLAVAVVIAAADVKTVATATVAAATVASHAGGEFRCRRRRRWMTVLPDDNLIAHELRHRRVL